MSVGNRIIELRKQNNFTQEYVAEKLNVSQQTISKWEENLATPDTDNLIGLSVLFCVTIEYLATGNEFSVVKSPKKKFFNLTKQKKVCFVAVAALFLVVGAGVKIHTLPVDWDAGACGGGYKTHIFDKYSDELVEKYLLGSDIQDEIVSIKAIRGTQEADWEDRIIDLQFDIQYEHIEEGMVSETLHFVGERYWFEAFDWGGAIIEG